MTSGRNRYPFTPTQWEELEHQALIFKYMVSGIPIPPDLISTIKRSFLEEEEESFSSRLFSYQPQHVGWNCFKGRKMDPEPGRCRRTDGKKWRCSKQAYIDSKYCEKHMHRGKNRARKPVEHSAAATMVLSSSDNQKDRHGIGYIGLSLQAHATQPHRNLSSSSMEDSWQFTPLTTSSSSSNHRTNTSTTHRFFDEWPPKHRDKSSNSSSSSSPSTTKLSISIFNSRPDNGMQY
ncbi:hypothetical protein HRI_005241300 [Hibiscus trionum]|uniref:Growth-regulating factor n=1 Tax=Hibiscus trionum TaxID=183268 RepID=A0A9W7JJF2_HIBTR|nr:hypothetical protein HRI_005241300 [Hibiscus trionum]